MKYLRRRTIIRESDFNKRIQAAVPLLYSRAEFAAVTVHELERDHMFKILTQHPSLEYRGSTINFSDPASILNYYRDHLYNPRYREWNLTIDNDGYIWIQSRKNVEPSRLGWAIAELWYE